MQNPFDVNANANSALIGGGQADAAFGQPQLNPQAGMRAPNRMVQQAAMQLQQSRAQRVQPAPVQEPMIAYNPETDQLFSNGKTFSGSNLDEISSYDRAGYFDIDNSASAPEGFVLRPASKIRAWAAKERANIGIVDDVQRNVGSMVSGAGSAIRDLPFGEGVGGAIESYGNEVVGRNPARVQSPDQILESPGAFVSQAAGGIAAQLPTMYLGAKAGAAAGSVFGPAGTVIGGAIGGLAPLAVAGYGNTRTEQRTAGVEDKTRAGATALGAAAMERLIGPEARILRGVGASGVRAPIDLLKGSVTGATVRGAGSSALKEAGTEVGQEVLGRYGAYNDLTGQDATDAYIMAGATGAVGGAGLGGATSYWDARKSNVPAIQPPAPPAAPAEPVPPPSLDAAAPVGTQGELLGTQQGPMQPAPMATPESYQEKVASLSELTAMLPEAQQVGGEYLQELQARIREIATELVALGDNTQRQRGVMSGVNEMVSGVPTELTSDELVSGAMPMVDAGFDPQQSMFNFDQPAQQDGLPFETTEMPTPDLQRAPKRKTRLTPDEMSYEGQPVAFSNADYQPGDTSAYTEPKLAAAINPKNRLPKRMPLLVKELRAATVNWNEKAIEAVLRKIEKADPDIFMAADQLVNNMRQERTNALAQQGQSRAQPGQTVGQLPAPKSGTVAQMRAQSQQTLADETQPDYTPNEMDPNLVKEKGPKGPASTLALRGQTQADLDTLNSREQWLAGPQENTGPAAVPANQLAMFDRKGQPTNPALGVPPPQSATEPSAPKRGPKRQKPVEPKADTSPTVSRETPANEPAATPPARKDSGTPQKSVAPAAERTVAVNTDLTANVPDGPLTPMQQRVMAMIEKADEDGVIDFADKVELENMVRAGRVPLARAKLTEIASSNVGAERGVQYRRGGRKAGPMTLQEVVATATEMVRGWTQGVVVKVVADPSELPQNVQDQMKRDGATDAKGAYSDGTVYVIASAQSSTQDVVETVLHELAGHHGLRGVLGDKFEATMAKIYADNGPVRSRADAKIAAGMDKTTAVEEVLSEMQEGKAQPRNRGIWHNIVAAFKRVLDKMFGAEFSDSGVEALLDRALEWTKDGTGPVPSSRFAQFRTTSEAITEATDPIKYAIKYDVIGAAKRAVLSSTFLRDLGARFTKDFARVDEHVKTVFRMGAKAGEIQKKAQDVSIAWQALSSQESAELSALMHEVTSRQLSMESEVKGLSPEEVTKQNELRAQFNALTDKQKTAYRMSRDELKAEWQQAAKLLAKKANDIYGVLIAKAQAAGNVAQVKSLTNEMNAYIADNNARVSSIRGDYFPLARFGQWSVVKNSEAFNALQEATEKAESDLQALTDKLDQHTADQRKAMRKANKLLPEGEKMGDYTPAEQAQIDAARKKATDLRRELEDAKSDPAQHSVSQFDTEGQAQLFRDQNGGYVSNRQDRSSKEIGGVSRQMLERLDQALEAQFGAKGQSSAAREAQRNLYQIYLSSLPEASALKRQMKRKTVDGANKDMHRNVVSTLFRNSFFLSRMEFGDQVTETLHSVRQEADDAAKQRAANYSDMQAAAAELERRHAATMQYTETPVQDKITAISYLWFLGASPAFLITNMMQPGMVTIPMLTARHGAATVGAMASAYKKTFKALSTSQKAVKEFSIDHSGLSEPHKKMLTYLMENRLLDVTMAHDLSTIADGGKVSKVTRLISNPSHYAELINRISSSIAAYDLEFARTGDSAKAQQYAAKVVSDTHLDYSAENAPYWMKPGVVPMGKLLFQFKKYQLGMMSLLVKNAASMLRGATKEEKSEARGMLAGVFITHGLVAGSVGLPVAGTVMAIFQLVARMLGDEPEDVEADYRNWLNRTFGKTAGTAIAKGVPAAFGIDMSQKAGLANVMNPLSGVRDSDNKKGRELYLEYLAGMAGPAIGGLGSRGFEFFDYATNGEYNRAAATLLPKMFADTLKGARYAEEGVMTRQGRTLAESGGLPLALLMASGFPLTAVADTYAANASKEGLKAALDDMKGDILREWMRSDPAERSELQRSLPELNRIRAQYKLPPVTVGDFFRYQNQMRRPHIKNAEIQAIGAYAEE